MKFMAPLSFSVSIRRSLFSAISNPGFESRSRLVKFVLHGLAAVTLCLPLVPALADVSESAGKAYIEEQGNFFGNGNSGDVLSFSAVPSNKLRVIKTVSCQVQWKKPATEIAINLQYVTKQNEYFVISLPLMNAGTTDFGSGLYLANVTANFFYTIPAGNVPQVTILSPTPDGRAVNCTISGYDVPAS